MVMEKTETTESRKERPKPTFLADILLKKRLPNAVQMVLFYLCLCLGGWYMMRRTLAYVVTVNSAAGLMYSILGNDVVCFFVSGVFPLLVFEIAKLVAFGMFRIPGAPSLGDMNYALRAFYGLGYLVYGLLSLLYFPFPLLANYGDTIVRFLIVGGAVAWYVIFEKRYRMPPRLVPRTVLAFVGTYAVFNLALSMYSLLSTLIS